MNGLEEKKKSKKWFYTAIVMCVLVFGAIGLLNVVVDPYFHFHKPITNYRLYEERYINDGIARNFDYDAIIIGNSLTQNFRTSQFDELFGCESVKLPYSGAGYMEIWTAIDNALTHRDDIKIVLVGFDLDDLSKGPEWQRYNYSPEYLYDDNLWNDLQYIYNKDVLYRGTLYNLMMTMLGKDSTSFDDYSSWTRESGPKHACATLDVVSDRGYRKRELTDYDKTLIRENIEKNISPVVEANMDTTFVLVIPPSSIAKWAQYYEAGEVEWCIDGLEYALPMILKYDNVEVYAFDDAYDVVGDLEHYSDTIHYDSAINMWMLEEICDGEHNVTNSNYMYYINAIRDYYTEYDYTVLNDYIN